MDAIFKRIVNTHFSELKGATVEASIPVPQSLINELVQAALRGNRNIASIHISIQRDNRVSADVRLTLVPWPLSLKLKLDSSVDLASYSSPKMRAWLENNRLLGSLGALFNALPPGIKLYGNQVVVDLGSFLRTPEQRKLLELVKSAGIQTETGILILDIKLKVES